MQGTEWLSGSVHPVRRRRAFTLVELIMVLLVLAGLVAVTLPLAARAAKQDSRQVTSQNNVRQILEARSAFSEDNQGGLPMRGTSYTNGNMNGWDGWHFGGKNNDVLWTGSVFDESAFSRPLNSYLIGFDIPRPPGYTSTGSGATWNFNHGTPTAQQRATLQIPVYRSPGDRASYQGTSPSPNPLRSCYNDVGTSYLLNMKWWDMPGLPTGFTAKFNEGVNRIALAAMQPPPSLYVWIHDQTAGQVANGFPTTGEFGGLNHSMLGFLDGRAEYMSLVPGAFSGHGYNLWP
jgi:prepilin-type N-terminal cleavage/methylation domain-containing protein